MSDFTSPIYRAMAHLTYFAYGLDVAGRQRWLNQSLSWTRAQRDEWKLRKLGDIMQFAWDHVPFYREYWGDHGVTFERPRTLEDLGRYPVLTKAIFRANCRRVAPDNLASIRHMQKHTGGSTGKPVHYFLDVDQWVTMQAFQLWGWSQTGYKLGDPVGVIAGGSLVQEKVTLKARIRNFVEHRMFQFGVRMDAELAVKYHERLEAFGTKVLYGYPSVIYLFARFLRAKGLRLSKLVAVVTTAEMLQPRYRKGIEEDLGCPVFDNLGCNDGGFESYECRYHSGYHYNDLQSILETDENTSQGEGRLLVTNLWNRSTPFIRYENGDMVTLTDAPCACGCAFPRIATIQGRTADILTFSNGRSLAGPALTLIFAAFDIEGWQVVQTATDRLEVRLCSSTELKPEDINHVRKVLAQHLDHDIAVEIKRVDQLAVTVAGKLKPIWSEVPSGS
ncbi:MAG TPA: hypothetical protein VG734_26740 [Lacunisphaera sp.]|nr:hypothetical protein [Lacunisphaera sp.]